VFELAAQDPQRARRGIRSVRGAGIEQARALGLAQPGS
jgi:hypothetical protein